MIDWNSWFFFDICFLTIHTLFGNISLRLQILGSDIFLPKVYEVSSKKLIKILLYYGIGFMVVV